MNRNICDNNKCMACGACENICPQKCIVRKKLDTAFLMQKGNECIECGLCERVCPVNNYPEDNYPLKAYASWSLNDKIRKESASGGIATTIYQYAFRNDILAVGAYMDANFECRLKVARTKADLKEFQNSKYTYSYPDDIYKEVENEIRNERKVIFIGLPCQIGALKNYFKVKKLDTNKLITIDLICHGTPMPSYLQQHIKSIEDRNKQEYEACFFRDSKFGTINFAYTLYTSDSQKPSYVKFADQDDLYQIGYHKALIYRDCCYSCQYAHTPRVGDLTIGDFHVKDVDECDIDIEDVSLILANTERGKKFLHILQKSKNRYSLERPLNEPIQGERQLREPSVAGKERLKFVEEYNKNKNFEKSAKIAFSMIWKRRKFGIDKSKKFIKLTIKKVLPKKIWSFLKKRFKKY